MSDAVELTLNPPYWLTGARWLVSAALVCGVWCEAGWCTAIVAGWLIVQAEAMAVAYRGRMVPSWIEEIDGAKEET